MLALLKDGTITEIVDYEQMKARVRFRARLNVKGQVLKNILGAYRFRDRVKCGLEDCGQWHLEGFLVETESGIETNIGNVCGKRYFGGASFVVTRNRFMDDLREATDRLALNQFADQVDAVTKQIAAVRDSASAPYQIIQRAMRPSGFPLAVRSALRDAARSTNGTVTIGRPPTDAERDRYEARMGRQPPPMYFENETIGPIAGVDALLEENNLHRVLAESLEGKLAEFRALLVDSLSRSELRRWKKWTNSVEPSIAHCQRIAASLIRLVRRSNLAQLRRVPLRGEELVAFNFTLAQIPE